MNQTQKELLENSITLYLQHDEKDVEDLILGNKEVLEELAGIWREHESAIRLLVRVINTAVVKQLVEKATPVETVGLRHELCGAEKIITQLIKYQNEVERAKKGNEGKEAPAEPQGEEGTL